MHRLTPSNSLPHAHCPGATVLPIGAALASANLKAAPVLSEGDELAEFAECPAFAAPAKTTVIAHDFGRVLADVKAADLSEAEQRAQKLVTVRVILERMGMLDIREVLAVVDVLRAQCDGDSSVALQECGEAIEGDLPAKVLRKIDAAEAAEAAMPSLVHLQAVKG
jgi:hypothetical protein